MCFRAATLSPPLQLAMGTPLHIFLRNFVIVALAAWWFQSKKMRAHNFSAGPGKTFDDVMYEAQKQLASFDGSGMSIMEMSHRDVGGPVQSMMSGAEADIRALLNVPAEGYHVMFMHGGAHAQFAAIPLNVNAKRATYINTGYWSHRARDEAAKYLTGPDLAIDELNPVTVDPRTGERFITPPSEWSVHGDSDYVYLCASETIDGLEFLDDSILSIPGDIPIVADFTSTLLSRPVDVSKYAMIFASGGKNLGPSGMTLVIVQDAWVRPGVANPLTPSIMSWDLAAHSAPIPSVYSTPPTFNIYMHSLVLKKLVRMGGMSALEVRATTRADSIYAIIDASEGFYVNTVRRDFRSRMNVPMRIGGSSGSEPRRDLEEKFTAEAKKAGLLQLFGHKVKGGLRVTLYNGVNDDSVGLVAQFMLQFAAANRQLLL